MIARGGEDSSNTSSWRLFVTRGVLIAICLAMVTLTMLDNHSVLAGGLALFFGVVAWIVGQDGIAQERDKFSVFNRAIARADAGSSNRQFGAGPVGQWAGALRQAEYRSLVGSIADATERSDESADTLLRELYDRSASRIDGRDDAHINL